MFVTEHAPACMASAHLTQRSVGKLKLGKLVPMVVLSFFAASSVALRCWGVTGEGVARTGSGPGEESILRRSAASRFTRMRSAICGLTGEEGGKGTGACSGVAVWGATRALTAMTFGGKPSVGERAAAATTTAAAAGAAYVGISDLRF